MSAQVTRFFRVLNAVDSTTGSPAGTNVSVTQWIGDYKRVGILLRRANHTAGSSVITVQGGFAELPSDSPTMTAHNLFIDNVTNSNVQNITNVNGTTLSANGDKFLWLNPMTPVTHLAITAVVAVDGNTSAWIIGFN